MSLTLIAVGLFLRAIFFKNSKFLGSELKDESEHETKDENEYEIKDENEYEIKDESEHETKDENEYEIKNESEHETKDESEHEIKNENEYDNMNICLSVCVCLSVCLSDLRSAGSADLTSIKNKFGPTYSVSQKNYILAAVVSLSSEYCNIAFEPLIISDKIELPMINIIMNSPSKRK